MILLPRSIYEMLVAHAVQDYPHECCGFITGTDEPCSWRVHRCTNIQNELHAKDPLQYPRDARTAYVFSRKDMEDIFFGKFLPKDGRVVAFYHSHPDHPAYFSAKDRMEAVTGWLNPEPGNMVLSTTRTTVSEIRMYKWLEGKDDFKEISLKVN